MPIPVLEVVVVSVIFRMARKLGGKATVTNPVCNVLLLAPLFICFFGATGGEILDLSMAEKLSYKSNLYNLLTTLV